MAQLTSVSRLIGLFANDVLQLLIRPDYTKLVVEVYSDVVRQLISMLLHPRHG